MIVHFTHTVVHSDWQHVPMYNNGVSQYMNFVLDAVQAGEFELDRAKSENNIAENSFALGYEAQNTTKGVQILTIN